MNNGTRLPLWLVAAPLLLLLGCATTPERAPAEFTIDLPGDRYPNHVLLYQRDDASIWLTTPVERLREAAEIDDQPAAASDAEIRVFPAAIGDWSVTPNGSPAWSPDGTRVAVAAFLTRGERRETVVLASDLVRGRGEVIWRTTDRSPFFLGWSPDSERVAILASRADGGLGLDVAALGEAGAIEVATGSPLYFDWLADGRHLVVHSSGRLAVYDVDGGTSRDLGTKPGSFQAPAVDPDGGEIAAVVDDRGANTIATLDAGGRSTNRLDAPGGASLSWSPLGRYLAVLRYRPGTRLGVLQVIDTSEASRVVSAAPSALPASFATPVQQSGSQTIAFAMEWEQDGQGLLVLAPARRRVPGTFTMRWEHYERVNGVWQRRALFRFVPTATYLQMVLPFFDQYARFSSRLAPDGSAFVFDAIDESGTNGVFVYRFEDESIVRVADGILPSWRPAPTDG